MEIKNIIFDLGGVILNIDYNKTEHAFIELGLENFSELYTQHYSSSLFEALETGKVSQKEFIISLQEKSLVPLTSSQIIFAWNAMLLDFPIARLQLLQQLRNQYNIFLLSNTNAIHLERFHEILYKATGLPSLGVLFEKTYYSHLLGLRKPDKEIYKYVMKENQLMPGETLFIDDSINNIHGAQEAGLHTILLQPPKTITDIFRKTTINL
jgi:glucose-1-phosphatase